MNWLSQEVDLTYQIRTAYTACIMLDGVKTGRDGCLCCCTTNCAKDDSDARGITPLDEFSGCVITLKASTENLETDANDIGGDGERFVVRGPPESAEISARVCSVTFRIPSLQLDCWRESLRVCLAECIDYHGLSLTPCTKRKAKRQLWMLVAHRLCYDRDDAWETGKYSRVKRLAHLMHIEVFEAQRPLWWLTDEESKRQAWRDRVWQHLPVPFQDWFQTYHTAASAEFIYQPTVNTSDLYSVRGDVARQSDLLLGDKPGPARKYAFFEREAELCARYETHTVLS